MCCLERPLLEFIGALCCFEKEFQLQRIYNVNMD